MNFTDCNPVYLDKRFKQPYILRRLDRAKGNERYYFRQVSETESEPYLSVTSWTNKCLGKNENLLHWQGERGNELAQAELRHASEYGTACHICAAMIATREINSFEAIEDFAMEEASKSSYYQRSIMEWPTLMKEEMAGWLSFIKDRNVTIVGVEVVLASQKYGIAGALDFVVEMDWYRGRAGAIIDFKTSKNFYDNHALQLLGYREIWNENFPDFHINNVFNLKSNSPYAKAKYTLKNQTNSPFNESVKHYLELVELNKWISAPTHKKELVGAFDLENFELENHIEKIAI